MKLHAQQPTGLNAITSYDHQQAAVNGEPLLTSFIVTPETLVRAWRPCGLNDLTAADLKVIIELDCPLVLLGTGIRQHFPPHSLLGPLFEKRIGIEIMDSGAACRTYNILMAEGRAVAAAIIIESATG